MKKKVLGIFICMLLIAATVLPVAGNIEIKPFNEKNVATGETSTEVWNKQLVKPLDRDYKDFIIQAQETTDGGYIAMGGTENYGEGNYDVWLIKTYSNGNEQWNKTFGDISEEWALGGQQTSDGGYIIIGSTLSFGGGYNIYLIKTDSNGNELWHKIFGGSGVDHGYFVQQVSDGGYIITGFTSTYGAGGYDTWLIKTDSNGDEEWNKTFGGFDNDGGFVVRQIDDGYIVTGWTYSYSGVTGYYDAWLIKTDSNGDEEWNKTYGGYFQDSGHDVQPTDDGGYIIIGYTSSYGDLDYDFYLIKTDSNGEEEWNNTFDGANANSDIETLGIRSGMSVLQITDGYIMTGITDASYGGGNLDVLLVETDDEGNEVWNNTFGGSQHDEGYWIDETSDDGYIISGSTISYGSSTWDGWLIKTDSIGNETWNKTYGIGVPGNAPPYQPSIPDGPDSGSSGVEFTFSTSTEDPEEDNIYYLFDWGDGTDSGWVGPYSSGHIGSASHSWDDLGDYEIRAKAKDIHDGESDWSKNHIITISESDLDCDGSLSWADVKPDTRVEGSFTVANIGQSNSLLDWEITEYPDWGTWTFVPSSGEDLKPEDGPISVKVIVKAPNEKNQEFSGTIKIENKKDSGDYCTIDASLTTPKNKAFNFYLNILMWLFERFPNAFPILKNILGV